MQTYVLALDQGKFYVGRTRNLDRRLRQHWNHKGAKFCKKHHPTRVVMVRDGDCEKQLTLELMRKFGVQNVRGGPWCTLKEPQVRSTTIKPVPPTSKPKMTTTLANTSLSGWTIGLAQKNKHGSNEWPILCNRSHPRLQLTSNQLPLRTPFGISQFNNEGSLQLNFCVGPYHQEIRTFFEAVDKWILEWAWENRSQLFSRVPSSPEVLHSMYTPLLTPPKGEYDPLLKAKIGEKCPVWVMNESGAAKGKTLDVTPGSSCVPIVTVEKIWIMGGRFGCTMRCQALICHARKEAVLEELFCLENTLIPVQA